MKQGSNVKNGVKVGTKVGGLLGIVAVGRKQKQNRKLDQY